VPDVVASRPRLYYHINTTCAHVFRTEPTCHYSPTHYTNPAYMGAS